MAAQTPRSWIQTYACMCAVTWFAGVADLFQQRQALLLRPVMNDSGQDVQVGRRNLSREEITCRYSQTEFVCMDPPETT